MPPRRADASASTLPSTRLLDRWYQSSPGVELMSREKECLTECLDDLFGYYLAEIGHVHAFDAQLAEGRLKRVFLDPEACAGLNARGCWAVRANGINLPLASDSMDAIFLPHTLEFSPHPHQLLREVERVLIPEGRVIILGINPWSLWGGWQLLRRNKGFPWNGRWMTCGKLVDWLKLLGFELEMEFHHLYRPPLRHAGTLQRMAIMEQMGQYLWPYMGAGYALRAVKRVARLTPIRPLTRLRPAGLELLGPTARMPEGKTTRE